MGIVPYIAGDKIQQILSEVGCAIEALPKHSFDMFVFVYGPKGVFTIAADQKHNRERVLIRCSSMEAHRGFTINRWNRIAKKIVDILEEEVQCKPTQKTFPTLNAESSKNIS